MLRAVYQYIYFSFSCFLFAEGQLGDLEKNACEVLCRLKNEGDEAKKVCPRTRLNSMTY